MTDHVAEKISKAKAKLVLGQPFFASIICNLPITEDNTIPTMATNGKWVKYNRDFVDAMTLDETMFVLCHEVGHVMFTHMHRRQHRDPRKWNIAGDYVINDLLVNEGIGSMPKGGLLDPNIVKAGGGTTDGVYAILPDNPNSGGPSTDGYNGTGIDECVDADGDDADKAQSEAETRIMVAQAAQVAKMQGKLSAGLARLVDEVVSPQVPWQDVLRRFVSTKAKVDYSFARPKRRFLAQGLYLPSLSGERMGQILIAVDCSGSIGEHEIAEFAAEIRAIKEDCLPTEMHVVYFDSKVSHHDVFDQNDELEVAPHGGGGTAFSPIFRYAEENGIDPVCCVVLTDLCCNDFGPAPHYPVLWVSNYSDEAPWGEVVMMRNK